MKKTISILLVMTMLLSMIVVSAMPTYAAEVEETVIGTGHTSEATGANAATAGNKLTPGANTSKYKSDSSWTAVSNQDQFLAMADGGKYYLTSNITINKVHGGSKSSLSGQANDRLDDCTIDGNGYTLNISVPLFNKCRNITMSNLTITGNLVYDYGSGGAAHASPLERWGSAGWLKMNGVTVNTSIDMNACDSNYQVPAGIIYRAESGSVFENVVYNGTIKLAPKNGSKLNKVNGAAGFAGDCTGAKFINCISNGKFIIDGNPFDNTASNDYGVGGFVGKAGGNTTFENCTNNMNFEISAPAETAGGKACRSMGGIAAFAGGAAKFTNCVNNGNITGDADATGWYVGGIVGHIWADTNHSTFNTCANNGNISFSGDARVGGILGFANASTSATDEKASSYNFTNCVNTGALSTPQECGGILGKGVGNKNTVNITDCTNTGKISSGFTGAGILAYTNDGATTNIVNCVNRGDVVGLDHNGYLSGIAAAMDWYANISKCVNYGNITADLGAVKVGAISSQAWGQKVSHCVNNGDVTVNGHCFYVGGAFGDVSATSFNNVVNNGDVTLESDVKVTTTGSGSWVRVAGLAALLGNNITFVGCENNGDITSKINAADGIFVSGFVAINYTNVTFDGCSNTGDITAIGDSGNHYGVGGYIGWTNGAKTFNNCTNSGDVYADCINSAANLKCVGGFSGYTVNPLYATNCKNTGDVYAIRGSLCVGGIFASVGGASYMTGCVNEGNVSGIGNCSKQDYRGVGGLVGALISNNEIVFTDCHNYGDVTQSVTSAVSMIGTGGLVGRASGEVNGGYTAMKLKFIGCSNDGDMINYSLSDDKEANSNNKVSNTTISRGGFVGMLNSVPYIEFVNCVNSGDSFNGDYDLGGSYRGNGGFVGIYRCLGQSWLKNYKDCALIFTNCVNEGNIEGYLNAGGFLGKTIDITRNYSCKATVTFNNCLNTGTVDARWAGGLYGYHSSDFECYVTNCINAGTINGGNGAGGAVGYLHNGDFFISNSVNAGTIDSIYSAGFTAYVTDVSEVSITDSYSVGTLVPNNVGTLSPVGNNIDYYEGNLYASSAIAAEDYDEADFTDIATLERAMEATNTFSAYGFDRLAALVESAKGAENSGYSEYTWNKYLAALEAAQEILKKDRFSFGFANGAPTFEMLSQAELNKAYNDLYDAVNGFVANGKVEADAKAALDAAQALVALEDRYTESSWTSFADALAAYEAYVASVADFDKIDPATVAAEIAKIGAAVDALVEGVEIRYARELADLNGKDGVYVLMEDILIEAPVENFAGTLIGNGNTITVFNTAVFESLTDATIVDLKVKGTANGAKSLFGKAVGDVNVSSVIIDVEGISDAALFDEAAEGATITSKYVISYADAGVAALVGNVNCPVDVKGALVMADAPALVGSVAEGSALKALYLDGTEYYGVDGKKVTSADVIASGKVAYEMNIYLQKYSVETETVFDLPMLVQVVGTDAAPTVGTPNLDKSNVVVPEYDRYYNVVGYKNNAITVEGGVGETPDMPEIKPADPVYDSLNAAIERAEALKAENYTEATWALLTAALANAKNALKATAQPAINEATNALNLAIAGLKNKPAAEITVDYSKLDELIAQAEALNAADYTEGSYATVLAMLAKAKAAKLSTDQVSVDSAKAALGNAILNLVKIAPKAETPTESQPAATEPAKKGGCGSVIGGAAVVLTAVIALGMGVSLKKKED